VVPHLVYALLLVQGGDVRLREGVNAEDSRRRHRITYREVGQYAFFLCDGVCDGVMVCVMV
jgi:hypothetical protein